MPKKFIVPNPSEYGVSHQRGFLPEYDPLERLPDEYRPINAIASTMPTLLGTGQRRDKLDELPIIDLSGVITDQELECAMRGYSFFTSAYVYATGEETADNIPEGVAVPLCYLAKRLGRQPILSYQSYGPQNWQLIDKNGPIEIGNIEVLQNFLGVKDEIGFIIDHVEIEANAGPALCNASTAQNMAFKNTEEGLYNALQAIASSLEKMFASLEQMPSLCDPDVYYLKVRPYLHAFTGIVYEGVEEYGGKPQHLVGETGAQSVIVPCFYALLGINFKEDPLIRHLNGMRKYMPAKHREFVEALEKNKPLVRDWVIRNKTSNPNCAVAYDKCLYFLWKFLNLHFGYADRYIHQQTQTNSSNQTALGTGDTEFMIYLKKHTETVLAHMILQ